MKSWTTAKYTINKDGIVDVDGDVKVKPTMHSKVEGFIPVKFGNVTGSFTATNCFLTSLKNLPVSVGKSLDISHNRVRILKGFPKVGADVNISFNKGIDLTGVQQEINGEFCCSGCDIVSLSTGPIKVKASYIADSNNLKSFTSKVNSIGGDLILNDNLFASEVSIDKSRVAGRVDLYGNPVNPDDEFDKSTWG